MAKHDFFDDVSLEEKCAIFSSSLMPHFHGPKLTTQEVKVQDSRSYSLENFLG